MRFSCAEGLADGRRAGVVGERYWEDGWFEVFRCLLLLLLGRLVSIGMDGNGIPGFTGFISVCTTERTGSVDAECNDGTIVLEAALDVSTRISARNKDSTD